MNSGTNSKQPTESEGHQHDSRIRFRIVHILYVMALLASSIATFGPYGLVVGFPVLLFWTYVFLSYRRSHALLYGSVGFVLLSCTCCCLTLLAASNARDAGREAARRFQCSSKLRQLALALHNYHDVYDSFPPAYVPDQDGKPMHSWRVLILPYAEGDAVYRKYKFNEPWDGPNNRQLLSKMPVSFVCPSRHGPREKWRTHTSYVAVVGERTAWPGKKPMQLDEISKDHQQIALLIEADPASVPWMEPRDLTFDQAIEILRAPVTGGGHRVEGFFYDTFFGRNVAMVDGGTQFVTFRQSEEFVASLLTADDDTSVNKKSDFPQKGIKIWNLGNCYRLGILVFLMLYPLPWIWLGRRTPATRTLEASGSL